MREAWRKAPATQAGWRGGNKEVKLPARFSPVTPGGDIVTAVSGYPVESMDDLITGLEEMEVGQEVELTIVRDGQQQQLKMRLSERPQQTK